MVTGKGTVLQKAKVRDNLYKPLLLPPGSGGMWWWSVSPLTKHHSEPGFPLVFSPGFALAVI